MNQEGFLGKISRIWAEYFNWVAMIAAACLLGIALVDIIGSKFFRLPLTGAIDLQEIMLLLVGCFGISKAQIVHQHIHVDLVLSYVPRRIRVFFNGIASALGIFIVAFLIRGCVLTMIRLMHTGSGTATLEIPIFLFGGIMALTCLPLLLVFVWELSEAFRGRA